MYIYIIKCSIYYKIGFSKNPKTRLKTIKTHNPLDVLLIATIKTDEHLKAEKELHNLFANKRAKREWFELSEDDLITLKVVYGFDFLVPINNINNSVVKNESVLNEVKEIRIDNTKIDYVISYFEDAFWCSIVHSKKEFKRCCSKFDISIIKKAIDSLLEQDYDAKKAINILFKVCSNIKESTENPSKYVARIVKAIMYKHYKSYLTSGDVDYLEDNLKSFNDVNDVVKTLNTKKFYTTEDEFWNFINENYIA